MKLGSPLDEFVFPSASGGNPVCIEDGEQLDLHLGGFNRYPRVLKERRQPEEAPITHVKKPLIGPDKKLTRKEVIPFIRRMHPQLFSMGSVFKPMLEDGEQLDLGIKEDMYTQFKNQLMGEFIHTGVVTRKQAKEMLLGAMYGRTN